VGDGGSRRSLGNGFGLSRLLWAAAPRDEPGVPPAPRARWLSQRYSFGEPLVDPKPLEEPFANERVLQHELGFLR
jgi:hypothetical protein